MYNVYIYHRNTKGLAMIMYVNAGFTEFCRVWSLVSQFLEVTNP
jgi:hypothetical protein